LKSLVLSFIFANWFTQRVVVRYFRQHEYKLDFIKIRLKFQYIDKNCTVIDQIQ